MTLRGMGSHKEKMVEEIRARFGYRNFTFQEASEIPGFERVTFFRLYSDKVVLRSSLRGERLHYRLATRYSQSTEESVPKFSLRPPVGAEDFQKFMLLYKGCTGPGGVGM